MQRHGIYFLLSTCLLCLKQVGGWKFHLQPQILSGEIKKWWRKITESQIVIVICCVERKVRVCLWVLWTEGHCEHTLRVCDECEVSQQTHDSEHERATYRLQASVCGGKQKHAKPQKPVSTPTLEEFVCLMWPRSAAGELWPLCWLLIIL